MHLIALPIDPQILNFSILLVKVIDTVVAISRPCTTFVGDVLSLDKVGLKKKLLASYNSPVLTSALQKNAKI